MIASVATAVTIEITGAMAIIHGTGGLGRGGLLREQLEHVGRGLEEAAEADPVRADARLEAAQQLALIQRMIGTIPSTSAKITIGLRISTQVLSSAMTISRPPPRAS
jgi:hypothetical protein